MHPVEAYLTSLHASLGAGTPETALANLLNAVGTSLKTEFVLTCSVFNGIFRHPAFLITPPLLVFRLAF